MECSKCKSIIEDNVKFCNNCGSPVLTDKFCSNCGQKLDGIANFCGSCGAQTGVTAKAQPKKQGSGIVEGIGSFLGGVLGGVMTTLGESDDDDED